MKNLHIVIGNGNTRKSSLIRCLTGAGQGNARKELKVTLTSNEVINVYVKQSGVQEYRPKTPDEFIQFIREETECNEILISLRIHPVNGCPNYQAYIDRFNEEGWCVKNIALLGKEASALEVEAESSVVQIPLAPQQPSNQTAAEVRPKWLWL